MSNVLQYQGHAVHLRMHRELGKLSLVHDNRNRYILQMPLGTTFDDAARFLDGLQCIKESASPDMQSFHDRCARWLDQFGLESVKICWINMPRYWGLTNWHAREIRLNTSLLHMPIKCMEEVLLHELCHFRHHSHTPAFWAELALYMPDWAYYEGILRSYPIHKENIHDL